jgi:hypothetical protein
MWGVSFIIRASKFLTEKDWPNQAMSLEHWATNLAEMY